MDRAKIAGIGKSLKMTLISYGIETAADITTKAIIAVPGFGPKLAADLVKWRATWKRPSTATPIIRSRGRLWRDLKSTTPKPV